jgi:2-polyprenyl-3-methyl-5-hydroxy-6-metoxy-1,4-benzoquinol methylase
MIYIKDCPVCESGNIMKIKETEYHYPEKIEDYYRDKRLRIAFDKVAKCDRNGTLKFKMYRCNDCYFIFQNPRFTDEEVLVKYHWIAEGMGIEKPNINKMNAIDRDREEKIRARFAWIDAIKEKRIRGYVEKYANAEAKTLLDFGGSHGQMCINLRNKYDCEVIELSKYPMHEKIKYIGENLECCKDREYDIILVIHVLEHVNKSLEYLLALKKHLKKENGIILIAVPIGYIDEWKHLKEPLTHCNFFCQNSLKRLLDIAEFECLNIEEYPISKITEPQEFGEIYYIGKKL